MSALDKSLDDIISSSRKPRRVAAGAKATGNKVGKKVGGAKKPLVSFKKVQNAAAAQKALAAAKRAAAVGTGVDLTSVSKVVVHNLPKDLKQEHVKDFFQSQVGGVQYVSLNYNEKAQFKGTATITFKSHKNASLAVDKYNGAAIDGGSSKLKLELIVDPAKKTLASRIIANPVVSKKLAVAKKQVKTAKQGTTKAKATATKAKPAQKKKPIKKKTVEELDQEMADYFES